MSIFSDLTLGQFLPVDSVVHRLDPRTKLCGALLVMAGLMFITDARAFLPIVISLTVIIPFASLPYHVVLKNIRAFRWLLIITFSAHALFTPGHDIQLAGLSTEWITYEGVEQGVLFTGRLVIIMTVATMLTLTTAPIDVADGLESLLNPFRRIGVPAHELSMMMVIALRFIPTLVEEAERIHKAQLARGADFSGNPIRRARKLTALLIPLMLSAFRRADELATAMDARCYRGGTGRTRFRELAFSGRDALAGSVLILMIAAGYLFT